MLFTACNSTTDIDSTVYLKKVLSKSKDGYTIQDSKSKLEWVDEAKDTFKGSNDGQCKPLVDINESNKGETGSAAKIVTTAENFCKDSLYISKSDWRVPTENEQREYLIRMKKEFRIPYYANPNCGKVASINKSDNSSTLVMLQTHNGGDNIGKEVEIISGNLGIRCVRDNE